MTFWGLAEVFDGDGWRVEVRGLRDDKSDSELRVENLG
jgi:hypothetical protein